MTQNSEFSAAGDDLPIQGYAEGNRELVAAYERYLIARGNAEATRRSYLDTANRLLEVLGSESVVDVERFRIRDLLGVWERSGLTASSIALRTCALRSFFKFIRLTGLTKHNPMLLIATRKVPTRIPTVLTIEQVKTLIEVARDPFERALVEVFYATGVRLSEIVKLRLEDIDWPNRTIRVHKGKGGKDRVVLFGQQAAKAMREYQQWRPSTAGFLFEAPARGGMVYRYGNHWHARFYVDRVQREISIGPIKDLPTMEDARRAFNILAAEIRGFQPMPVRPYRPESIGALIGKLGTRANLGRVHPHALRRAMASHMLQRGANLRVVQDLLGHERLNTTMRYVHLNAEHIRKVAELHPHAGSKRDKR